MEKKNVTAIGSELFTTDYKTFQEMTDYFKSMEINWWKEQEQWSVKDIFPERFNKQVKYIQDKFLPLLKPSHILCDLASATGEFSFLLAGNVSFIDGYELSDKMVSYANEKAKINGVNNVLFQQKDALELQLERQYDAFLMMGLLTCITSESDVYSILKKVFNGLKKGGYIIIKDTLTLGEDDLYCLNCDSNYYAIYRTRENYRRFYLEMGFELVDEVILHQVEKTQEIGVMSIGAIFRKV